MFPIITSYEDGRARHSSKISEVKIEQFWEAIKFSSIAYIPLSNLAISFLPIFPENGFVSVHQVKSLKIFL